MRNMNIFAPLETKSKSSLELQRPKPVESTPKPARPESSETIASYDVDAEHKDDTRISKAKPSRFTTSDAIYSSYEDWKEEDEDAEESKGKDYTYCWSISGECRICGVKVRFRNCQCC